MKKLLFLTAFVLLSISCAKQSDVDCLAEKLEIIEQFDRLIELSQDAEGRASLIRQKNDRIANLNC
ncbi:hypothetical protein [Lutibacter sp.]|uniref:hypothetical protein n=1 Tax=Lutibacter sp. TaxID=1925666 RepID=UPI0027346FC4|nr:hypothetical protein [Lutibacter sp.]MDP3313776.1 hypothetical protein [Lutibacter sp.]